ncbi:hypothetical protein A6770_39900 [Nostoc minutum NIES-26]|uniref:Uncharacterized protein n=1 Tax=Nostoc minutum NIES-26 TaxID=1844469 RepID=A0A367RN40_9NOSO|nr:hypothetical protein A6770_39900 [Nostoc minutum NIES-26]
MNVSPPMKNTLHKDFSVMSKYYLCEAENADVGVSKVTPYEKPVLALTAAENSTAAVHFISTVNPLAVDEEDEE